MSTEILRNFILTKRALDAAQNKYDIAKSEATKFVLQSGLESAQIDGYTLSLKEYKRSRVSSSEEIEQLKQEITARKKSNALAHAVAIRNLQKQNFYNELEISNLIEDSETLLLEAVLEKKLKELAESRQSKYEVFAKVNTKCSEFLSSLVEQRQLNKMIAEGKALLKECGKSVTKNAVIKFVLAWSVEQAEPLETAWETYKKLHKEQNESNNSAAIA